MKRRSVSFSTLSALRSLYDELSAPRLPIYTTIIRVQIRRNGRIHEFTDRVTHTGSHSKLTKHGYHRIKGVKRIIPVVTHTEWTQGSIYNAPTMGGGASDPEWLLLIKIDGDLARKKTGYVEDGLAWYVDDFVVESDPAIQAKRARLEKHRRMRRESNSSDLLFRYGDDPEAAEWIRKHRRSLDGGLEKHLRPAEANPRPFYSESFRDEIFDNSVAFDDAFREQG